MALAAQVASSGSAAVTRRPRSGAEAARYSVLRRLAPALRHDMVVNLQAVAMMAEVLNARLERGLSNPNEFQKSVTKINRLAREAVMTCLDVAAWIEPGEDEGIRLREGVDECVGLLAGNFNFRGFSIANEVPDVDFEVSREALRNLLSACLITLTDASASPADVLVKAEVSAGFAVVTVRCDSKESAPEAMPFVVSYRPLDWADVQALAVAESVELFRTADQIVMRIARAVASTPLQIVPV
jgi:C4-dicarboxylate-specific signal transduction histidine kinase